LEYATKYPQVIFTDAGEKALRDICLEIAKLYEIEFREIGVDWDHAHFTIQSMPTYSPIKILRVVKSIRACKVFGRIPSVQEQLRSGSLDI